MRRPKKENARLKERFALPGNPETPQIANENARMNETGYVSEPDPPGEMPDWLSAVALAFAIAILLVVFVWIIVRLEPILSDFVASEQPIVTVTPTE
ncbi:hypothetical protein BH20CHL1_BH20CHL1_08140 [soil metagenome]